MFYLLNNSGGKVLLSGQNDGGAVLLSGLETPLISIPVVRDVTLNPIQSYSDAARLLTTNGSVQSSSADATQDVTDNSIQSESEKPAQDVK